MTLQKIRHRVATDGWQSLTDDEIRQFLEDPKADENVKDEIVVTQRNAIRDGWQPVIRNVRCAWQDCPVGAPQIVRIMECGNKRTRAIIDRLAKVGRCCVD